RMSGARAPAALVFKTRIDESDARLSSGRGIREKLRERLADVRVAVSPQREKWEIAKVIAAGESLFLEPAPDRRQRRGGAVVLEPIRLGRVHVEAVRISLRHNSGEIIVAHGKGRAGFAEK